LRFFRTKLAAYLTLVLIAGVALASSEDGNGFLQSGPTGDIDNLSESQFYVDGSSGSGKIFVFTNGHRSLHFIPMIHQAEPEFYSAVAREVKSLKANGMDLYYEFIDFEAAPISDKRRIRAMFGFLPSPEFYAENISGNLVAQDNTLFLGFPGGRDIIVDATPAEIADAYEAMNGPLKISEENLSTAMDEFVMPTSDPSKLTQVTIDWRNERLAQAISEAKEDIVVLYGAAHGVGTMRRLQLLDPRWHRVD